MILNTKRNNSPRLAKTRLGIITSAAALVAALAIYAAPRLVLAQTAPTALPSANNAPPSTVPVDVVPATAPVPPVEVNGPTTEPPDAGPATPPAVEPGPKSKSHDNVDPTGRVGLALPATPVAPGAVVVGAAPGKSRYDVAVTSVPEMPHAPNAPDIVDVQQSDSSIEKRLRRLEKMVESLVRNQERKDHSAEVFQWKGQPGQPGWVDPEKLKLQQDMAKREAARAEDQARRAAIDAEKAMKQQERAHKDILAGQIKDLDKQRETLQREVEKLQNQIQRLGEQRDRLEQEQEKPPRDEKGFSYTIQSGDTLAIIVQACRGKNIEVSTEQIVKTNPGLRPERLKVGQKIWIPAPPKHEQQSSSELLEENSSESDEMAVLEQPGTKHPAGVSLPGR